MLKIIKKNIFIFFLIIFTFLIYAFFFNINKKSVKLQKEVIDKKISKNNEQSTIFTNVEYTSKTSKGEKYVTKGEKATVSSSNSSLINLSGVLSYVFLKDKSKLEIKSDFAIYDKNTNSISYEKNIIITNKDTIINADYANYNKKENIIEISKNLVIMNLNSKITSDKALINISNQDIVLSMNKNSEKVYGNQKK